MITRRTFLAAGLLVFAGEAALAQAPGAPPAGIVAAPAGRVITRKALTACKLEAKSQKLSYLKRRKFIRACVGG